MQGQKAVLISIEAHAGLCELRRREGIKIAHSAEQAIRGHLASRGIFFGENNPSRASSSVLLCHLRGGYGVGKRPAKFVREEPAESFAEMRERKRKERAERRAERKNEEERRAR